MIRPGLAGGNTKRPLRFGKLEIQVLRDSLHDLSVLDNQIGGGRLWQLALYQLDRVETAFNSNTFDNRMRAELPRIAGELKRSIGWFYFDSGKQQQARSYFSEALNLAYLNSDHFLISRVIANMTRQTIDLRLGRETAHLAHETMTRSGKYLTPRIRSLLAIREAQGWAIKRDKKACETALTQAHSEFDLGTSDDDPKWIPAYMRETELIRLEGLCRAELGEYAKAEQLLVEASVGLHNEKFRRDLAICLIWLSANSLLLGEMEQAGSYAQRAATVAAGLTSSRVNNALIELRRRLAPRMKIPAIREAIEQINAHVCPQS